jgi:hypothetical protein
VNSRRNRLPQIGQLPRPASGSRPAPSGEFREYPPRLGRTDPLQHLHGPRPSESDASLPSDEYEKLLTAFVASVRIDLDAPDLPFGVGELYDNGKRDTVRAARKLTAEKVKGVFFVSAEKLRTFDGGTPFDAASQIELGERFAAGMAEAIGKP